MQPIWRKTVAFGIVAVFRNEWGRVYGLKEIGNRKSWYRWQTPDGKRHRFAKDAIAYLDGKELARLAAKVRERQEAEAAWQERREKKMQAALDRLTEHWHIRKEEEWQAA